jgi:hypothetical protein
MTSEGNFLAQLANRGAGLLSPVRARAEPMVGTGDGVRANAGPDRAAPAPMAPQPEALPHPAQAPAVGAAHASGVPAALGAAPVIDAAIAPVASVQRRMTTPSAVSAAPVLPLPAAPAPLRAPALMPPPAIAMRPAVAPPPHPRIDEPTALAAAIVPAVVAQAPAATDGEQTRRPASPQPDTPITRVAAPPAERAIDRVIEKTRVTERLLEPASARAAATSGATLERLPGPARHPPVAALPSTVERIVHVHIGAIEIHGAAVAPAAPAAPVAAPAPAAAPASAGFDAYARLRSYAPWEW